MNVMMPQLAKEDEIASLPQYIEDENWVLEQKLDGHRVLLCSPGGPFPPTALTRGGSPYTRKLPQALRDFRFPEGINALGPMGVVLDGELVGDTFWVFDIPHLPGPLDLRRAMLEGPFFDALIGGNPAIKLVPQARTKQQKAQLAEAAIKNHYEGLVAKRRSSVYAPGGRNDSWRKLKFVKTIDCFVMAVRDDGKESVKLGLINWTGPGIMHDSYEVREVGRSSLIGKEKNGEIKVGDVLEVRYLYAGAGGRLYQPTILRKRDDKGMFECVTDQMVFVNKEVLEGL